MKILLEIPKEFEGEYENDRFADSLCRVKSDLAWCRMVSGNYERETVEMLYQAFLKSKVVEE